MKKVQINKGNKYIYFYYYYTMAKEILKTGQEESLQSQIDFALQWFRAEINPLKKKVKEQEVPLTVDKMKEQLEIHKERIQKYLKINGAAVVLKDFSVDVSNEMYKMKYEVFLWGKAYVLTNYFKVIETLNNSYIQFQIAPGKTNMPSSVTLEWKVYDVNVIREKIKDLDIRIVYNEQKTQETILKTISDFDLKKSSVELKEDKDLENTQVLALNTVSLWKEIRKEAEYSWYYRAVFMKENNKYRELWKVYFNEKWEFDPKKTLAEQPFNILNTTLKIKVNTADTSFSLDGIDSLRTKIIAHRAKLKELVENSRVWDPKLFEWFNKLWSTWKQTSRIWLVLIDDTYTIQRGKNKEDILKFWFDEKDNLFLKDLKWELVDDKFILPVIVDNKQRLYDISNNEWKLQIIESTEKESQIVHELPELEWDVPASLKAKNLYVYNRNKSSNLEYFSSDGKLLAALPTTNSENNEWTLGELSQDVKPYDLFEEYVSIFPDDTLKKLNIFENDLYDSFLSLLTESNEDILVARPVVRVLEWDKYAYYTVEQSRSGAPFVFEKDEELYKEAQKVIDIVKSNLQVLDIIANTKLLYTDNDEVQDLTTFQAWKPFGFGLLDVPTDQKLTFLKTLWNADDRAVERKLVWWKSDELTLRLIIKKNTIKLDGKKKYEEEIEWQNYLIRSELQENNQLVLIFDTIRWKMIAKSE